MSRLAWILAFLWIPLGYAQQQEADNGYTPEIGKPLFGPGKGSLLLVDEGHHNFHTLKDRFAPFGRIAERSGFRVQRHSGILTAIPEETGILVIANALNVQNADHWGQPVYPAFTREEIECVRKWVWNGAACSLLQITCPLQALLQTWPGR